MPEPATRAAETTGRRASRRPALGFTLPLVLAATSVSAGLVVYAAWRHDLENGVFAVLFAMLSTKAALSWLAWSEGDDGLRPSDFEHTTVDDAQKQA